MIAMSVKTVFISVVSGYFAVLNKTTGFGDGVERACLVFSRQPLRNLERHPGMGFGAADSDPPALEFAFLQSIGVRCLHVTIGIGDVRPPRMS
jgi:hypothetical protein